VFLWVLSSFISLSTQESTWNQITFEENSKSQKEE